jgi:hypothetical protein
MILLSALLASLTGLVSGERPVERAQVELSAVAAVVHQAGTAATQASIRPESQQPRLERRSSGVALLVEQTPVRSVRTLLRLKQSWLQ